MMITDNIKNGKLYFNMNEGIKKGLEYLMEHDLKDYDEGRYDIDGDNVFLLIQCYDSKEPETAKMEAHHRCIDIQYVVEGQEKIGYIPVEETTVREPYNEERDLIFFNEPGVLLPMREGMFAIFYPHDGHRPGVKFNESIPVKKAVVKVKI
jgi:biofilm protein TabA